MTIGGVAGASPLSPSRADWWSNPWLWAILALINALPVLVAPLPMMPDFFNHFGRYYVMLHQDDPLLASYYSFHETLSSNSGVDLLMLGLGRIFTVADAARLVVAAIPVASTVGIFVFAKTAHRAVPATALLAVPFVWSFPFVFGFLNFCLGLALALLGGALWIRIREIPWGKRIPIHSLIAFIIWITHLVAFGIFLIIVTCFLLERLCEKEGGTRGRRAVVDFCVVAWPVLLSLWTGTRPCRSYRASGSLR